ncbi:uncharacterized protein LOC141601106 [Silene latifolia]|uniref:uncharacterized protein LOC141601106 n=1 Tax=Silene latifolia TaxID=37657 RepID=UPI003D76F530
MFNVIKEHEPYTFKQAQQNPRWIEVMSKEISALEENQTWKVVPLPSGHKGFLDEEVYMKPPEGFDVGQGLSRQDYSLFTKTNTEDNSFTVALVYVDDVLLTGTSKPEIQRAALHVVKYLKGTINAGLFYKKQSDLQVVAFSDADWGQCAFSSKSLSGYCVLLGQSLVSWKTKKQATVSKSSAESEYRSLSYATYELVWRNFTTNKIAFVIYTMHCVKKHILSNKYLIHAQDCNTVNNGY